MKQDNDNTTAIANQELTIVRTFNMPLQTIWKAWTEPESFKKWWGPKGYDCPSCDIDFKVGGKYLASMRQIKENKEVWSTGKYKEIIPQQKIVYTDSFADSTGKVVDAEYYQMPPMPVQTQVTIKLTETGGKTLMELEHKGIPETMHEDCRKGWQSSFDKMETEVK